MAVFVAVNSFVSGSWHLKSKCYYFLLLYEHDWFLQGLGFDGYRQYSEPVLNAIYAHSSYYAQLRHYLPSELQWEYYMPM